MRVALVCLLNLIAFHAFCDVQHYTLDNGLKILVKEDHRAPVAVSMIWYNVGSADEPAGITGISHALEHLMFKGTLKYPLGVFSKTISELGGQENAFTGYDYTAYFEKIPAQHLATSFELEADRMQNLLLDKSEFAKEIKVIQEERRLRTDDNPQALAFERFMAAAHLADPYHHPVIGWMNNLLQMNVDDARNWYKKYYAPNNATLVVVGDVHANQVYALAKKYFGHIPSHPQASRKTPLEPPALGKKQVNVQAPAHVPVLMLGYTVPTVKTTNPKHPTDPYALELIAAILDAGDNSRFSKHLIRGRQLASSLSTSYNLYSRYQTQFAVYGTASQGHNLVELQQGIDHEITRLKQQPVSDKELQRVKTQLIAQKTYERDSIFSQAMELGLLETIELGWQTAGTYVEQINQVTPEQIQKASQRYFNENQLTETKLTPVPAVNTPRIKR